MKSFTTVLSVALVLVTGSVVAEENQPAEPQSASQSLTQEQVAADVLGAMDLEADPCQDFYRYACGQWLDRTEIPADETRWVRSFSVIQERNRNFIREALEDSAKNPGQDPDRKRIGTFYAACMDEAAVEKADAQPVAAVLERIGAVKDARSLMTVTGELQRQGANALFGEFVAPDFKDPETEMWMIVQGGLGMPDRDYYVSEDETKKQLLAEYQKHVARMLGLLGEPASDADAHAAAIVALETRMAQASRPRQEMRNVDKLYDKRAVAKLGELSPGVPWDAYLAAIGYPAVADVNVMTPEFFETLGTLVAETDPAVWRSYLRWHAINGAAPFLSKAFVDADFDFYGTKLRGQVENEPRWKRCVDTTQQSLGEAVGKVYVDAMFPGSSKSTALEMIGDIDAAFEKALPQLAWMDETTRGRAVEKMNAVVEKIGYPDTWRDYSSMKLAPTAFFANVTAAMEFEFDRQHRKIGQPVDEKEWAMTPQMVNAGYNPLNNDITFPAGILQPPFFHRDFPAAMNYGGIGAVIGHELSHGFDDQGRKFDPSGQLREWWEPEVSEQFDERAQCVRDQYSSYEVEPGLHVNGQLTLGENIADLGGLKQAYVAYKLWEGRHGKPEPEVPPLTNDQLFFVAWAQGWCGKQRPEQARLLVTTNPHSPPQFRAVGPPTDHPAFAPTFSCAPGTPMNPEKRCEVW